MRSNGSSNTKRQSLGCGNSDEKSRRFRGRFIRGTDSSFEKVRWPDYCIFSTRHDVGRREGAVRDLHGISIAGTLIPNNRADQPRLYRLRRCRRLLRWSPLNRSTLKSTLSICGESKAPSLVHSCCCMVIDQERGVGSGCSRRFPKYVAIEKNVNWRIMCKSRMLKYPIIPLRSGVGFS